MARKVGIVGIGQTKYEDIVKKRSQTYYDMVFEATKQALDDAGLERGSIDTVVEAAYDLLDGRTIYQYVRLYRGRWISKR